MRSRLAVMLVILLAAALACSAGGAPTSAPATAQVIMVTATPLPAASATPAAPTNPPPSAAPTETGPHFGHEVKFSTTPDPATATRTFKARTQRIYGMWQYSGMTAGLTIRRDWYLNGALWQSREVQWDFAKYGASGTVTDVSVFNLEQGLVSGPYELRLYIDGKPQFAGDSDLPFRSFTIGGAGASASAGNGGVLSPDGKLIAAVEPVTSIQIGDGSGSWHTLVTAHQIAGFGWLPDSNHIVYGDRQDDGSGTPLGISYDLVLVNVTTGASTKLSNPKENLHDPVVSPDGKHIALLMGSGYGDACMVDRAVAIMDFDPAALTRVSLTGMDKFSGLTTPTADSIASVEDGPDFKMPGVWQSATQFKIAARFTCSDGSKDGVYVLDVLTKSAAKVGDLPKPQ